MENIRIWLDNLNGSNEGFFLIFFGICITLYSKFLHKLWKKEGYKPFRSFRREGKTQSEDNYVIIMHMRTLLGIYVGIIVIIFGIYKLFVYYV